MRAATLRLAERAFGLLVLTLPRPFRQTLGAELRATFRDLCRDQMERRGVVGLGRALARSTWDVIRVGVRERRHPTVGPGPRRRDDRNEEGRVMTWDGILHDLRHGARTLAREPIFTLVAVLMLAVGIGGTTGIYTLVHRLLLAPMPGLTEPGRVVAVGVTSPGSSFQSFPHPLYEQLRDGVDAFEGVAAHSRIALSLRSDGPSELVPAEIVSGNYFDVLGVRFARGRGFSPDETASVGGPLVAVLSHRAWVERFGSDPRITERDVTLNGQPFDVVGVAAPDFVGLSINGPSPEVWVPLSTQPVSMPGEGTDMLTSMGDSWLFVSARMADGVSLAQASASVDGFVQGLKDAAGGALDEYGMRVTADVAIPYTGQRREVATILSMLLVVVFLLLAIVCSNLASLFLTRAAARRREMAIRLSLGSSRARVVRQLLVESSMIGALGGVLGLLLAEPTTGVVLRLYGRAITVPMSPDWTVATFAMALAIGTGLLFGLAPALSASRGVLTGALGAARSGTASGSPTLRSALAVAQVSLSAVLLVGATLFGRSLANIAGIDPGFDTRGLVTARVELSPLGLSADEGTGLYRSIMERVNGMPGVAAASLSLNSPFAGSERGGSFLIEGRPDEEGVGRFETMYNVVWPGYFRTMGTPLVRGRDFSTADDAGAPPVIVVSASFAERFWPGEDPLGRRILRGDVPLEIVGVVGDVKFGTLSEDTRPMFYVPLLQRFESRVEVVARAAGPTQPVVAALRETLSSLDDDLPAFRIATLDSLVGQSLARYRLAAAVTGGFTLLAMLLAALGLYGLLSYGVSQRRHEIGVRLALGARRREVTGMVTRRGLALGGTGLLIGLLAAGSVTRLARTLLYDVSPLDPIAYGGAGAVLLAVALAASWLPARRASRVDPAEALRHD